MPTAPQSDPRAFGRLAENQCRGGGQALRVLFEAVECSGFQYRDQVDAAAP